jgi:hypothetical protein
MGVQAGGKVAFSHASVRRCVPVRFFWHAQQKRLTVYILGMSLVALEPSALLRRQQALFVVPAEAVRSAAGQSNWAAACAALRVNALSCIKSAEHGWIGASFSCCEILAVLHLHPACSGMAPDNITLSKGHAAAMQYLPPPPHPGPAASFLLHGHSISRHSAGTHAGTLAA